MFDKSNEILFDNTVACDGYLRDLIMSYMGNISAELSLII